MYGVVVVDSSHLCGDGRRDSAEAPSRSIPQPSQGPVVELEPVTATQSSTYSDEWGTLTADNCIDGDTDTLHGPATNGVCATNDGGEATPWIAIDYGTRVSVERVELFNRKGCCWDRTRNVDVR